jgi:hypothetical protein
MRPATGGPQVTYLIDLLEVFEVFESMNLR